jgi:hypothetical protein
VAAARAEAVASARKACDVLLSYKRVTRCDVIEWNPTIDFTIDADRTEAIAICGRAVKILAAKVPDVVGKAWKLRVLAPGDMLSKAGCDLI